MNFTEEGILLKRINYSETSQIVTFYTKTKGIKTYLYKGSKKKTTALYPLNICEFNVYQRSDSQLAILSDCSSLGYTNDLSKSPLKSLITFFVADVMSNCIQTEEEDIELYNFLSKWVRTLNDTDQISIYPILFLTQLIIELGYTPDIQEEPKTFDIRNGEFLKHEKLDSYCIYGEDCVTLYNLFQGFNFTLSSKQKILQILIDYCTIHIPKFNVNQTLEIVTTVLYD